MAKARIHPRGARVLWVVSLGLALSACAERAGGSAPGVAREATGGRPGADKGTGGAGNGGAGGTSSGGRDGADAAGGNGGVATGGAGASAAGGTGGATSAGHGSDAADAPPSPPDSAAPPAASGDGLTQRLVTRALGVAYYHTCFITPTHDLTCRGDVATPGDPRIHPPAVKAEMIQAAHNGFCVLRAGASDSLPQPLPGEDPYLALSVTAKKLTCWGHKNTFFPPANLEMDPIQYGIGYDHGCALNRDHSVVCWGQNGTNFKAPEGLRAKAITVAAFFNCAIQMDDTVVCWGIKPPTPPAGLKAKIVAATFHGNDKLPDAPAGTNHACAIKLDDSVQCWGTEVEGNLTPPADLTAAKDIAVSTWDTCALRPNGEPVCWGRKVYDDFDAVRYHKMPEGLRLRGIRASMATYCGIKMDDDTVVCWGDEQHDHITFPASGVKVYVPTER